MKKIKPKKQKHNEPNFDELSVMLSNLENFPNEDTNPMMGYGFEIYP